MAQNNQGSESAKDADCMCGFATDESTEAERAASTAAESAHAASGTAGRELSVEQQLAACREERRASEAARRTTAYTRFIAVVPSFGFFVAAIVLSIGTLRGVLIASMEFLTGHLELSSLAIEFVEHADLFLLAVVLYILALGLLSLFVTDELPLPAWLVFHDFDDLKERLVSVIGAMLGVYFLGYVLKGAAGLEALWMGLAVAVVVAALTLFMRNVLMKGGHHK